MVKNHSTILILFIFPLIVLVISVFRLQQYKYLFFQALTTVETIQSDITFVIAVEIVVVVIVVMMMIVMVIIMIIIIIINLI